MTVDTNDWKSLSREPPQLLAVVKRIPISPSMLYALDQVVKHILRHVPLPSVDLASSLDKFLHAGPVVRRVVEMVERELAVVVHPRKLIR